MNPTLNQWIAPGCALKALNKNCNVMFYLITQDIVNGLFIILFSKGSGAMIRDSFKSHAPAITGFELSSFCILVVFCCSHFHISFVLCFALK